MLAFLPAPLLGLVIFSLQAGNVMLFAGLILLLTPLRFLLPGAALKNRVSLWLIAIADTWCTANSRIYALLPPLQWTVDLPENLQRRGWYMVCANHQTWVDILVLFHVFNGRIPFLKFFLKQELIWLPLMGPAMYALDFPFMKRYSKAALERRPELRGKDMETTRRVCAKYRHTPVSVINFLEGTRFTPAKQAEQDSPYQHLLRPKAGGLAFVLSALGPQMHSMLDVTIGYPGGAPRYWDFACGRVSEIQVRVQARDIPASAFAGDYENDPAFRAEFQAYVGRLWEEKDHLLARMQKQEVTERCHV